MAYSRWNNSTWYTYWVANKKYSQFKWPKTELKNRQTFCICDLPNYYTNYGEIKQKGIDVVLEDIKGYYKMAIKETVIVEGKNGLPRYKQVARKAKNPSDEEMEELRSYIQSFMDDVDYHFKWLNFFTYEWYYPIRNKIWNFIKN